MSNRRSSAFLTRRPLPVAEVRCEGCVRRYRVECTRHVTLDATTYVLCLDCVDRVEAEELSRLASYYTP